MGTSRKAGSWGKGQHVVLWRDRSTASCGLARGSSSAWGQKKRRGRPAAAPGDGCLPAVTQEGGDVEVVAVESRGPGRLLLPRRRPLVSRRLIARLEGVELAHALSADAGADRRDLHPAPQA